MTGVDDWIISLDALAMYCHTYVGDFTEARQLAKALVDRGGSVPLTDLLCPGVISQAAFLEGKLDEAAALAESDAPGGAAASLRTPLLRVPRA